MLWMTFFIPGILTIEQHTLKGSFIYCILLPLWYENLISLLSILTL